MEAFDFAFKLFGLVMATMLEIIAVYAVREMGAGRLSYSAPVTLKLASLSVL